MIDNESGYALVTEVADKRETGFSSSTLELFTFLRCMHRVLTFGLSIDCVVTDQHIQVLKFFSKILLDAEPVAETF